MSIALRESALSDSTAIFNTRDHFDHYDVGSPTGPGRFIAAMRGRRPAFVRCPYADPKGQ